jgi:hypothetical protein
MTDNDNEFETGDVFVTPDGPIKIVSTVGTDLTVTDPTVDHPQDARASNWDIDPFMLRDGLEDGRVERGSLEVTA